MSLSNLEYDANLYEDFKNYRDCLMTITEDFKNLKKHIELLKGNPKYEAISGPAEKADIEEKLRKITAYWS